MAGSVYVVEAQSGLIKIGCAEEPRVRLAAIRTHSPVLSRMVAVWPGTPRDERNLHDLFRAQRSHSEWFRIEGPVVAFLAEVRGLGLPCVEAWDDITFEASEERKARGRKNSGAAHRALWADPEFRIRRLIDLRYGRAVAREFGGLSPLCFTAEQTARVKALHVQITNEVTAAEAARGTKPSASLISPHPTSRTASAPSLQHGARIACAQRRVSP